MDFFSLQFLYALGAIVLIDLVLAGDNAIVIALAARKLPPGLRNRAIVWGTAGAIIVRSLMTGVVVWLLNIPGLMLAGGALLLWIAVKLLAPQEENHAEGHAAADSFWGAMKTIVIADAVMGLDNVLAVAGAAQGSFLLVVLGLLISIPIVVWGSQMILKLIERFPSIVYLGAAVLAATAVKMMLTEPLTRPWVEAMGYWTWVAYIFTVGGVLLAGRTLDRSNKAQAAPGADATPAADASAVATATATEAIAQPAAHAAVHAELQAVVRGSPEILPAVFSTSVEVRNMNTLINKSAIEATQAAVLIPVNGSAASDAAVSRFISRNAGGSVKVHLVHAAPMIQRHVSRFVNKAARSQFLNQRFEQALAPVQRRLHDAGFEVETHLLRSRNLAGAIAGLADQLGCERIVIGAQKKTALARLLTVSVPGRVLERANVPVEVVLHAEASMFARFAWPAGVGAVIAVLAID